jgi:hypothetical protein
LTGRDSGLKFIYRAQPALDVSKSPLVVSRQESPNTVPHDDLPAVFVIRDHSRVMRAARLPESNSCSEISQLKSTLEMRFLAISP